MQDKQRKEIVDSQGNAYKSTRDSKVKQFLKDMEYFGYWFSCVYYFGRNNEFGDFKELFCFMRKFLWDRWKVF